MIRFKPATKPKSGFALDLVIDRKHRGKRTKSFGITPNELIDLKINIRVLCDTPTCPNKAVTNNHLCEQCESSLEPRKRQDDF